MLSAMAWESFSEREGALSKWETGTRGSRHLWQALKLAIETEFEGRFKNRLNPEIPSSALRSLEDLTLPNFEVDLSNFQR